MQILKLVHASAADVRAASLCVAVDNAKGRVSHEASCLACNHRHARNGMGATAFNGLTDIFVDEFVGSSQLISSQPGSWSKPFLGLVRFIGFVIRFGS